MSDFGRLKIENNQISAQLELLNRPLDQCSVLDPGLHNVLQTMQTSTRPSNNNIGYIIYYDTHVN